MLVIVKATEQLLRKRDARECHSAVSSQEVSPSRANCSFSWQPAHLCLELDLVRDHRIKYRSTFPL